VALPLNLTIGTPCSGGNHFPLTGTLAGTIAQARTYAFTKQEMAAPITDEEIETYIRVTAKLERNQLPANATPAQIKTAIEAKTLNLTVS